MSLLIQDSLLEAQWPFRERLLGKSLLCPWAGIWLPKACTPFFSFIYMYRGLAVSMQ